MRRNHLPTFSRGHSVAGAYEVIEHLGSGGMADVYSALDIKEGGEVAIKLLNARHTPTELDDTSQTADLSHRRVLFFNELALATRVSHPNIVKVLDFGLEDKDQLYIVMELLRGLDGSQYLHRHGATRPSVLIPLFIGALDALTEAHALGIVHKDLKPSNIFFSDHAGKTRLTIMDFGIAQRTKAKYKNNRLIGSPHYMAPEYIKFKQVSPASDVYQMGLTLAELLTSRRVVDTKNMVACLKMHIEGSLCFDETLMGSPLGSVISRATALDHGSRYQSAGEFKAALEAFEAKDLLLFDIAFSNIEQSAYTRSSTSEVTVDVVKRMQDIGAAEVDGSPSQELLLDATGDTIEVAAKEPLSGDHEVSALREALELSRRSNRRLIVLVWLMVAVSLILAFFMLIELLS